MEYFCYLLCYFMYVNLHIYLNTEIYSQQYIYNNFMNFKTNQVVWAKIKGYPWWPAIIAKLPKNQEECFRVNFFGEQTHALIIRKDICKYEQKYDEYSDKKNKKLLASINEANNYLQIQLKQKPVKQASASEPQPSKKRNTKSNNKIQPQQIIQSDEEIQKKQSQQQQIKENEQNEIEQKFLEVDLKKINNIEVAMKDLIKQFIQSREDHSLKVRLFQYFSNFDIDELNNQELTKTKIPNIIKFLLTHLKEKKKEDYQEFIILLQNLHKSFEDKIISWLTNTEYYQKYISFQQAPKQEDNEFGQKIQAILKKNYHIKKDNARRISQRLKQQLQDQPIKRKKNIMKELKKKSIDLKYNRKDGLTNEDIEILVQKILNQ